MAAQRIVFNEFGSKSVPDPCMSVLGRFMLQFQPKKMDEEADNCSVNVMQVGILSKYFIIMFRGHPKLILSMLQHQIIWDKYYSYIKYNNIYFVII